jgi:predicted DNA-binding transcriptional regulator AlpA
MGTLLDIVACAMNSGWYTLHMVSRRPATNVARLTAARERLDLGAGLSKRDIAAMLGVTTKTIDRLVIAGQFPRADLRFNARTIRWSARSVRHLIDGAAA